ncbi:MAG TPA: hypothetical protein VGS57_22950 [Thermoanaerobaculia bacterium]|jgi:hypothetical protein|nr:hypothetical protein [Thermoanaerobaculia bacterium]
MGAAAIAAPGAEADRAARAEPDASETDSYGRRSPRDRLAWRVDALLLAVLAAFFVLLEARQPFYFLQDDNRTGSLGLLVQYARSLGHGELALYNFHQFLGEPSFAVGSVPFLYPPVYLGVWLSRALFGYPDAAIDILVIAHFAIGLLGMSRLLRALGLSRWATAFAALAWPLSSNAIYTACSWWHVALVIAYLPWMIHLACRLVRRPSAGAGAWLVVLHALLLYGGHVQLFVYALCFEALCAALALPRSAMAGWRAFVTSAGPYLLALYLTAAVSVPVIQPLQAHVAESSDRGGRIPYGYFHAGGFDLISWLQGFVDPYRADPVYYQLLVGSWDRVFPYLSFVGWLTVALLLAAPLLLRRGGVAALPVRVFAVPLLVAFLWTTGTIDRLLFLVPVLNRFRWHFRVNAFLVFFVVVVAAMTLTAVERWSRMRFGAPRTTALIVAAMAVQLGSLAALYAFFPQRSFNHRRHLQPVPLQEPLAARLAGGRIVSLGWHSDDPYSSAQVGFNYASYWGLFQYAGYANLLSNLHARYVTGLIADDGRRLRFDAVYKPAAVPVAAFEQWAVSWYLLGKNAEDPSETASYAEQLARAGLQRVAEDSRRIVFHDPRAEPLVYVATTDGSRERLTPRVGGRSLTATFAPASQARRLVACFLAVPGFSAATLDGEPLALRSDDGRMTVDVPAGARGVRFVYHEPELLPALRNAALLLVLPLLVWAGRRFLRGARRRSAPAAADRDAGRPDSSRSGR